MPADSWFNDNSNRAYPFLRESVHRADLGPFTVRHLPNAVIVDAGFVLGSQSRFDASQHSVYLNAIRRAGSLLTFEFASDAPELHEVILLFTRNLSDALYLTSDNDTGQSGLSASSDSGVSESLSDCYEPLWSGFLVTGDLSAIDVILPGNGALARGHLGGIIEPALLQNLAGSYVAKIGIANDDRTRTDASDGCPTTVYPFALGEVWVQAACLTGAIVFREGYNATIRQNTDDGSIVFSAVVGAGAGEPCQEIPLGLIDSPPDDSTLLTGGPRCNEVLRTINGIGGPAFSITSDVGATVTTDPTTNRIIINLDMQGLAVCFTASESSESL